MKMGWVKAMTQRNPQIIEQKELVFRNWVITDRFDPPFDPQEDVYAQKSARNCP